MECRRVIWGVIVFLGVILAAKQATAQGGAYACWGGCYNECIIQDGKGPSQRLPCYWNCLGGCSAQTESDYHYYCQIGCSMKLCIPFVSDGGKMEKCLENCSNNICNPSS